MGMTQ